MSEAKNIKGIDEETWAEFKSLAAKHRAKAADMLKILIKEHKERSDNFWEGVFAHKPVLSKKQYGEFEKRLLEIRNAPWRT